MIEGCESLKYYQYHTVREKPKEGKMITSPMFVNKSIFRFLKDAKDWDYKDFYMTQSEQEYQDALLANAEVIENKDQKLK